MPVKSITPTPADWDRFVRANARAHVLQQTAWGELKSRYGWTSDRVALADDSGQIVSGAQLLFKPLPLKLGTMAYLAMGPLYSSQLVAGGQWSGAGEEANSEQRSAISQEPSATNSPLPTNHQSRTTASFSPATRLRDQTLATAIDQCAARHHAAFLKWEPGIYEGGEATPDPAAWGFRPSPQTVQPPRTVLIDISGAEEAILGRMNQGTRRKIRQSLKNDIRYWQASREEVPRFTAMMHTTGERNAFGVHEPRYYEQAYDLFVPAGDAALILAEHEDDGLAGIMVFALGTTAWYLYGASSNLKRNLMAAYGVQWAAIQWARAKGCTTYDMWGIPDEDEPTLEAQFESRSDGLWGVYGFKRGWGGRVARSLGAWDKVYNPAIYGAYQLALRVRG
ncbi:MAG: peptidoglycan bridge formation glycyltransferase FemA/FemB family protein [Anaerolineae bacterium]|nr:peptidoglycan bridge formation glycyltransferase FemA/FemB family protein [Anaerolineae bacterium]